MKKIVLTVSMVFFTGYLFAQKVQLADAKPKKLGCSALIGEVMFFPVDTSETRGVADNYHMWDNGSTIVAKFMPGGSKQMRDRVMQYAKEWEQYANITFKFVDDNIQGTNVRIRLGSYTDGLGHNSAIGTMCNLRPQSEQTLNLDTSDFVDIAYYEQDLKKGGPFYTYLVGKKTDFKSYTYTKLYDDILSSSDIRWNYNSMKGTTMHEFGHALGLMHEQSYPGAIKWNKADSVYAYYKKTQNWDKDKVNYNVFMVNDQFYTNGTDYDPASIMQYPIAAWQTTDGFSISRNNELSSGDKMLIATLYPKGKKTSDLLVPKVDITNFTKLDIKTNTEKNGLSIYPSFDLKTNSKLGQVYFVARPIYEKDGKYYYFLTSEKDFNWGGTAAVYLKMNLLPDIKKGYNKGKQDLELFIPYSKIPGIDGKKIKIEFTVVLDDISNGQLDKLMYYSSSAPLVISN